MMELEANRLNPGQKRAYSLALKTRDNLLVTGAAGTGKSAVLLQIIESLKKRKFKVKVAAFTGLAAQHLRGVTLSRLLGLGLAKRPEDLERYFNLERAERNLAGVTDLIVDEVSMISGDYLALIDRAMREATGEPEPFGGIRVIFSGDFMQLPPVRGERDPEFDCKWAFQHPLFQLVTPVNLTESMRQRDAEDVKALASLRRGEICQSARNFIERAQGRSLEGAIELYPTNRAVHEVNFKQLASHPGEAYKYPTYFKPEHLGNDFLGSVPIGSSVDLKKGVPVIVLTNHILGRYSNGSQGMVRECDWQSCWVELSNGRTVEIRRKLWTIEDGSGKPIGTVDGMPLHLGWAATIHRSQGMTLESVKTDVSRCWEPGQAYVALTRTRSLDSLALVSRVESIKVDPEALAYHESLGSE